MKITLVLSAAMLLSLPAGPASAADKHAAEPVAPKLTPKLRGLFAQEMTAVLQASREIVTALATGDHAAVAKQAQAIHDSFILDKKLTARDRHDLETALPPAFLDLDGAFHQLAAKLAEAARQRDGELQTFYFSRMLDLCQTCHSQYATDKFPGFGGKAPTAHAH